MNSRLFLSSQASSCALCMLPACENGCVRHLPIEDIFQAIRGENVERILDSGITADCFQCPVPACEAACRMKKTGVDVKIREVMHVLQQTGYHKQIQKTDLTTEICGIPCINPFFLSSSVVSSSYEMTARAFEEGWAGAAWKTAAFFIPDEVSPRFSSLRIEGQPFAGFKNIEQISDKPLQENLDAFRKLKHEYPDRVLIASIMGRNKKEWTELAALFEDAGADLIECNFSCPNMEEKGLGSDTGADPELVAQYTAAVKEGVNIPVLAKMTPNITDMRIPARAAVSAGADGIAAINTIKSIMNVSLEDFSSAPDVEGRSSCGGYSGSAVRPIALRFISDMALDPQLKGVPISGMGGISTWRDAAEFIALGCSTVQITTSVMEYGYRIIRDLTDGLSRYLAESGIGSVKALEGKALGNIVETEQLDRKTICYPQFDQKECIGCGRCVISCNDGGHQALCMDDKNYPQLISEQCVGCHLCLSVCPAGAIKPGQRLKKTQ